MLTKTPVTSSSDQHSPAENTLADTPSTPPSRKLPPMRTWLRWKWLRFLLPMLFVLLGSFGLGAKLMDLFPGNRSANKPLTQVVERQTVPVSITANGNVKAQRSINLSPKTAGIVKTLLVKEGDQVRQGQVIALMDDSSLRGQLVQYQAQLAQQQANLQRLQAGSRPEEIAKAEAQLTEASANLQQLQAGNRPEEIAQATARLQQSQATLKQREDDWQRHQQLYKEGAISGQTLEQKRADRDVAQNQVMEAQQVLVLQKAGARAEQITQAQAKVEQQAQSVALLKAGTRKEEIEQAQAQVQAAQGSLLTIQEQLKDTKILAPFDGIVLEKFADIGAFVSPSMGGGSGASASFSSILTLTSVNQQVVVNLSESQIAKVKLGQAVTIKADAFPSQVFTGKVEQISPQAKVAQNVTSVEVRVSIDPTGVEKLKAGMNVEAQFAVGRLENVMLVPNASVVKQVEGAGVYVLDSNHKSVFRPIQTGMTVGKQTEVKSGLEVDEQVLLSPPDQQKSNGGLKFPPAP
jgi:HlyD family secretion protein